MDSASEKIRQAELPAMPPRLARHAKQTTRIILGETASRHLDGMGCRSFAIIGKERSGEHKGRWVIHLRDATHLAAQDASDVLMGRKVAVQPPAIDTLKPI